MHSSATNVKDYLGELESERRVVVDALLLTIRGSIQPGFDETMRWGMISFEVPLEVSGPTYNKQPLSYIGLAAQKHHFAIYLMALYAKSDLRNEFEDRWKASGRALDFGKGCVRFKSLADCDLATVAWAAALFSPAGMVQLTGMAKALDR